MLCPFCQSDIRKGATVCAACGAYMAPRYSTVPFAGFGLFLAVGWWIMWGPLALWLVYTGKARLEPHQVTDGYALTISITVIGGWLLWKIFSRLGQPVWRR